MAYVRPHDEAHQKERYSGKKCHTMKALVISDYQRYVLFASPLFGGSVMITPS